ncbi:hypothetical protein QJS64_20155 (plasmid) [Paraclostridium bifermentans]|uniref:HEPN domain-containing protein n=1 Tax=Paraclostridium bifermentans TaxID=1490 RepID=A0ABY8R809_PARBF|nr:hypothetical protein QJS64_20155 [Paraclostridium bifermentans]
MKIKYQPIFSYNSDTEKNAYMNWRMDRFDSISNLNNIAKGYSKATMILCENCLENNRHKDADIIIFPILFSANHSIELYLKSIMWSINILTKSEKKFEKHHNICQIYNTVKNMILEFEEDKDHRNEVKKLLKNLEEYIKEIKPIIESKGKNKNKDNMDFPRYPLKNDWENHFYVEEFDNVVVDLENFIFRFKDIFKNLDSVAGHYSHLVDVINEMESSYI